MLGFVWRLTRSRGAKNLPLVLCATFAVFLTILGKADAPLFNQARAAITDWTAPVISRVSQPIFAVENWFGSAASIFSVYSENKKLREENAELLKWQNVANSLGIKLQRYEQLLSAVRESDPPFITANVIGETNRPFVKTMILDAGTARQVKKGQAVVDDHGLLGRIYVTGENTSWVILLTDLNSRVPVIVEPSRRRAILVGDNTPAPQLELDVSDGPVKEGDRVLSTGDGGLLPPGQPIGIVRKEGGSLRVALFARPGTSDIVRIASFGVPEPPEAVHPASAELVVARGSSQSLPIIPDLGTPPQPGPVPLQSQNPSNPQFDGQVEELDR